MVPNESDSTERGHCTHFVLAQGVVAQVEYCACCAIFHVNIDSLSIRFQSTALRDLRNTLTDALAAYERAQQLIEERTTPTQQDGLH
jgi:hypothetical protein